MPITYSADRVQRFRGNYRGPILGRLSLFTAFTVGWILVAREGGEIGYSVVVSLLAMAGLATAMSFVELFAIDPLARQRIGCDDRLEMLCANLVMLAADRGGSLTLADAIRGLKSVGFGTALDNVERGLEIITARGHCEVEFDEAIGVICWRFATPARKTVAAPADPGTVTPHTSGAC